MPTLNLPIGIGGPLVLVAIGISAPHAHAMVKAGKTPPPLVQGTFLIDTGASCTCIDPQLVAPLSLTPTGVVGMQTPSTAGISHNCHQYDVMLVIPNGTGSPFVVEAIPVIETHLKSQGIDGLIGRDILQSCTLIYSGSLNLVMLSY